MNHILRIIHIIQIINVYVLNITSIYFNIYLYVKLTNYSFIAGLYYNNIILKLILNIYNSIYILFDILYIYIYIYIYI